MQGHSRNRYGRPGCRRTICARLSGATHIKLLPQPWMPELQRRLQKRLWRSAPRSQLLQPPNRMRQSLLPRRCATCQKQSKIQLPNSTRQPLLPRPCSQERSQTQLLSWPAHQAARLRRRFCHRCQNRRLSRCDRARGWRIDAAASMPHHEPPATRCRFFSNDEGTAVRTEMHRQLSAVPGCG